MNRYARALIGLLAIVTAPIWVPLVLIFDVLPFHLRRAGDSVIATVRGWI